MGSFIQEASDETNLLANFLCLYSLVPEFVLMLKYLFDKRRKSLFGAAQSGITSLFPLRPNQVPHMVSLIFFLKNNFFIIYIHAYMYIYNQRFLNEYIADNVLDKQDLIYLPTIKCFQFNIFLGTILFLSLKKDRILSILTLSNRSLKRFTVRNHFLVRTNSLHPMKMYLTVQGIWHVEHGSCFYFSMKEWICLVWPMRNRDLFIPTLLPFCVKEFVDFRFQVSIRNPEFVGCQIYVYVKSFNCVQTNDCSWIKLLQLDDNY